MMLGRIILIHLLRAVNSTTTTTNSTSRAHCAREHDAQDANCDAERGAHGCTLQCTVKDPKWTDTVDCGARGSSNCEYNMYKTAAAKLSMLPAARRRTKTLDLMPNILLNPRICVGYKLDLTVHTNAIVVRERTARLSQNLENIWNTTAEAGETSDIAFVKRINCRTDKHHPLHRLVFSRFVPPSGPYSTLKPGR